MNGETQLREVLDREKLILVDSSCRFSDDLRVLDDWYAREIFPAENYSELNKEVLVKVYDEFKEFVRLFDYPNTSTVEGVVLETERFRDIIGAKRTYLEEGYDDGLRKKRRIRKNPRRSFHGGETQRELLDGVLNSAHRSYLSAKRASMLEPDKGKYDSLETLVKEVTKATGSKIDFSINYAGNYPNKNGLKDFHADEQLVARAIYESLFGNVAPCILTRDSDIKRIMVNSFIHLTRNGFQSHDISNLESRTPTIFHLQSSSSGYYSFPES